MIKLCAFADEASSALSGQIKALKKNNISLLELRSVNGENVKDITLQNAKYYYNELSDNGISVWSIGSPLGKVDISVDFNKYLDTVKKIYDLAKIFNAKNVRVFSFFNAYNQEERVIEYLNKMVELAKSYNLTLAHENEKEIFGDKLASVLKLYKSVSGLKVIYDPANFVQVGENMNKALNSLYDKVYYYHIKDVIAKTGEIVPAGHGDGEIEKIISKIDGDKVLTVEPHLALFDGYLEIDKTVMKNKFTFQSNKEAFDCAVKSLKDILTKKGYKESNNGFIKV